MRATVQHVKKSVQTTYFRDGVFGGEPDVDVRRAQQVGEWDDVVCVMSPEEAEVLLQVLQLVESTGIAKLRGGTGASVELEPDGSIKRAPVSSTMIRGLESDLRKLTTSGGSAVFEPGLREGDTWRLSSAARARAAAANPPVIV